MNHLSTYALDRLISEGAGAATDAHLDGCPACRARLDERRQALGAIAADPHFARERGRLLDAAPAPTPARWRWPAIGLATAAAAIALFALSRPPTPSDPDPPDGLRPKGGFALAVVRAADGRSDGPFPAGAEVELRVAGWEAAALVLALDDAGAASVVWPPGAAQSGRIAADGRLDPRFRVTPGDLLLLSLFSTTPLDAEAAREAFEAAARACDGPPEPACSAPAHQPGEIGRAWTMLRTEEAP